MEFDCEGWCVVNVFDKVAQLLRDLKASEGLKEARMSDFVEGLFPI